MKTYIIGQDNIGGKESPDRPGGMGRAIFLNVRHDTPIMAYEALSYRQGDVFIDHEQTRRFVDGRWYPVYEVLKQAQFDEKYPQPEPVAVPDAVPVGWTREHAPMLTSLGALVALVAATFIL